MRSQHPNSGTHYGGNGNEQHSLGQPVRVLESTLVRSWRRRWSRPKALHFAQRRLVGCHNCTWWRWQFRGNGQTVSFGLEHLFVELGRSGIVLGSNDARSIIGGCCIVECIEWCLRTTTRIVTRIAVEMLLKKLIAPIIAPQFHEPNLILRPGIHANGSHK
jgi:hypothetical protein